MRLTDGARLEVALRALGFKVTSDEKRILAGDPETGSFTRFYREVDGVYTVNGNIVKLSAIYRKYAEIGNEEV